MYDEGSVPQRLAPPPRALSIGMSARVVFGNFLSQFGSAFFLFGMIFVWVFGAESGVVEWVRFLGDVQTAEGTTTDWRETNLTIGERRVYEISYTFRLPGGVSMPGSSYRTGSWMEAGQPVTVEYVDGDPPASRIRGMRASEAGLGIVFVFLFPVIGLLMAYFGARRGLRSRRLMTIGSLTRGTLKSSVPTGSSVNNQPVMRLTFEFEAPSGGVFEAVAKTHRPERLQDEDRELIVYDPHDPSQASVLDELPCQPRVGADGNFEPSEGGVPAALHLLLPGASVMLLLRYVSSLF